MRMKSILDHEKDVCSKHVPKNILIDALHIKQSIRNHKWIEGEKGRRLTWPEAKNDWLKSQPLFKQGWISLMFALEPYMLNDE